MALEKIKVMDYDGNEIAIINESYDYDNYLDQLNSEEKERLFSAMNKAILNENESITVNQTNFSDIMCDWNFEAYEGEKKEDEDVIKFFYHYTASHKVPNADYYTIQHIVNGFGNDSYVSRSFSTKEEAIAFVENNNLEKTNIIPQWFNEEFNLIQDYEYDFE